MPTLNWIGKDRIINYHKNIPLRILKPVESVTVDRASLHDLGQESLGQTGMSGLRENKIIHGDNLEALKSLLPEYEGRIKCIYIDPPYNTGNENWIYNDNVSHPRIKKWLGEVFGAEGEDFTRHDKWLCMMYPRLVLLRKLLSEDGVIFISIDDNEQANLKLLMDEIFGENNFLVHIIWKKRSTPPNDQIIGTIPDP